MQTKEHRGAHMVAVKEKNRARIVRFYTSNPSASQIECSQSLKISAVTIRKHVKAINSDA